MEIYKAWGMKRWARMVWYGMDVWYKKWVLVLLDGYWSMPKSEDLGEFRSHGLLPVNIYENEFQLDQ